MTNSVTSFLEIIPIVKVNMPVFSPNIGSISTGEQQMFSFSILLRFCCYVTEMSLDVYHFAWIFDFSIDCYNVVKYDLITPTYFCSVHNHTSEIYTSGFCV